MLAPTEAVRYSSRQTEVEPNDEVTLNGMVLPKRPKIRINTHLQLTEAYFQRIIELGLYLKLDVIS